jgi:hypothetical protein
MRFRYDRVFILTIVWAALVAILSKNSDLLSFGRLLLFLLAIPIAEGLLEWLEERRDERSEAVVTARRVKSGSHLGSDIMD